VAKWALKSPKMNVSGKPGRKSGLNPWFRLSLVRTGGTYTLIRVIGVLVRVSWILIAEHFVVTSPSASAAVAMSGLSSYWTPSRTRNATPPWWVRVVSPSRFTVLLFWPTSCQPGNRGALPLVLRFVSWMQATSTLSSLRNLSSSVSRDLRPATLSCSILRLGFVFCDRFPVVNQQTNW